MNSPLDRFMPTFDFRQRFEREVRAPADVVLRTAKGFDLQSILLIRGIIESGKLMLGGMPDSLRRPVRVLLLTA